jgi:hypothetical protein
LEQRGQLKQYNKDLTGRWCCRYSVLLLSEEKVTFKNKGKRGKRKKDRYIERYKD